MWSANSKKERWHIYLIIRKKQKQKQNHCDIHQIIMYNYMLDKVKILSLALLLQQNLWVCHFCAYIYAIIS